MPKEQADIFVTRFVIETWYRTPSEIEQDHKNSELMFEYFSIFGGIIVVLMLILAIRNLRK